MITDCCRNMGWKAISMILCMFGFLKEFRPSEPFITDYLTGPWQNFTSEQVMQDIYPIGTYSYLATLVLVFLITDFVRYKPIIIICGLSGTITFITLMIGNSLEWMQFLEFTYGLCLSTEVAYYTYIYAKVDKEHYQAVSSHTRAAYLFGRFLSGAVAQLLTTFEIFDYHQLIYLTVLGMSLATLWALFLPPVSESMYFHRIEKPDESNDEVENTFQNSRKNLGIDYSLDAFTSFMTKCKRAYAYLWRDFLRAYTNGHVVKWSLWWSFATCGHLQVLTYMQPLWQTAVKKDAKIYNGAVEAVYTIIGALAVFGIGKLNLNWPILGEATLAVFSIVEALLLFLGSENYNIWVLYAVYIIFGVIYQTIITVASFEVAKNLADDSYGLVFGLNTLLALVLQALLTFVVVSGTVLDLHVRTQFQIYAGYFMILGLAFMFMAIWTIVKFLHSGRQFNFWADEKKTSPVKNC